jgi:glycerol-3-phosphate O-acyltransferase
MKNNALFPFVLDHKPGFFLTWFLYKLFKRVSLDESMKEDLKRMSRKGTLVYAIKYRGLLDYLLYHYNFRRNRLPYPKLAFDLNVSLLLPFDRLLRLVFSNIKFFLKHWNLPDPYKSGFYNEAIHGGTTSLIFLVDPKGFKRHFIHQEKGHLESLLESQRQMEAPIYIVPQLVLYKKSPEKSHSGLGKIFFGYKDNPGTLRKIVLFFRHHRRAFIDFGEPINLKAYLDRQPDSLPLDVMAGEIKEKLIEAIDRQKRVILGPIMKSRQELMEVVLRDPVITKTIGSLGDGNEKKIRQLRQKAGEYFREIAADYNIAYIQFFELALTWFWNKIFEGIDVDSESLAYVREWARKGVLIFVPSHKSHIDYLVLNYVLFQHHMHTPRIAAGRNLTFFPMGHIFRKSGAFFIRRTFKGARLYAEVFNRYVKALLQEGHPIEFFIEGGRSRNGKLVFPKTGFLSILLQAHKDRDCEDLIFVPASIIYDRVMEEKSYLREMGGERKEKESFWQMLKARRFLERRYGKVYIRFNQPISLNSYLSKLHSQQNESTREMAFHLIRSINAVSLVTPLSLVATAILSAHRRGFHISWLRETVSTLLGFFEHSHVPLADSLKDPRKAVDEILSLLIGWKVIDHLDDNGGDEEIFYFVEDERKLELEYYKNSIIHFFVPHAFIALSLLTGKGEIKSEDSLLSDYSFLEELFKMEFFFDRQKDISHQVHDIVSFFVESSYIIRNESNGGYQVTKSGFEKLPLWATLLKTYLESYWIAVKAMGKKESRDKKREELIKNMSYLGKRFHKLGVIDHIESLSQLNFKNALGYLNERLVKGGENPQDGIPGREDLSKLGQRIQELIHF